MPLKSDSWAASAVWTMPSQVGSVRGLEALIKHNQVGRWRLRRGGVQCCQMVQCVSRSHRFQAQQFLAKKSDNLTGRSGPLSVISSCYCLVALHYIPPSVLLDGIHMLLQLDGILTLLSKGKIS